eukprot:CAMPEP_0196136620 /NCGR_PEP_ID=MMETSP0910-20130528/4868_1 /TAXON_ID=49265 /ORGANISM="Thalassiosira rotula, Strain GSO102" /LENGTH=407 /DNA_ID=CAMNT_0041396941 /DNA_START=146 /DNA_END=1369 /DNA_ORIENTATION=-
MISYVGKRVATDAVSDLTEPLISLPTNSINPNAIDDSGETKAEYPLLLTVAHGLLVLGGLATSMVAIVSSSAISVYVACSVCIVNSIAVAVKQRTIFKSGGLREGIKALQGGVGLLLAEVNNLVSVVDDLQGEADCLSDIQKQLDDIVRDQGSNSNEFISLLKENESNLKKMKNNLRGVAVADIAAIFLLADKDGDMTINFRELNELTLRVQVKLSSHGINIDTDQFNAMVQKNNDVTHVLKVVEEILFAETTEYSPDAPLDDIKDEEEEERAAGGLVAAGALAKLKRLGNLARVDEEGTKEDAPPMFTMQNEFASVSLRQLSLSKKPTGHSHSARAKNIMKEVSSASSHQEVGGRLKNMKKRGLGRIKDLNNRASLKNSAAKGHRLLKKGPPGGSWAGCPGPQVLA